MDVLTSETCSALNKEIIKQVTSSWFLLVNYQDDARSNKHKFHQALNQNFVIYLEFQNELNITDLIPLNF